MSNFFDNIHIDWLGKRRIFIAFSIFIMVAGLVSALGRELTPGGTDSFNLGVDFKGGTMVTTKFRNRPTEDEIRQALNKAGINEPVIQSTNKADEVLIKIPLLEEIDQNNEAAQVEQVKNGRERVKTALDSFGSEATGEATLDSDQNAAYKIIGTDSVGAVAGAQLRNQAATATLLGLAGILLFIAFRYDWTYAAGAVLAVFHDVIMVLSFFSIFQWEVNLTVIAAILTIVGFSVNDSIVIFDRMRENIPKMRTESLFSIANDSINQTLSRTVITAGLVILSVLALVFFGGEVLRSFSLALLVGLTLGCYSTVAIASPIAIWWQGLIGSAPTRDTGAIAEAGGKQKMASASRRSVSRRPVTR